ncbi:MAG: TIGR03435 family protein [Bryobacterales bacterium]|nr:TIGR03435 family protein [Bryobacterales bacterium]MBV9398590.1 TIGR03435 family protein [Bryobacterales bacterium]
MILETLLAHPAVQTLGRALLYFIWQGSLLALLMWIVKTIAPPSAARLRYAAASLIMLMMPIALVVTATWNSRSEPERATSTPRFSVQAPLTAPEQAVYFASTTSAPHVGISGWVVCIWIIGVLLLSVRAVGGWIGAQTLKGGASGASIELEETLIRLKLALRLSAPVRLCTSSIVRVPTAIGWLRPYILLPVTAITGLNEVQIRAILAHELAHIRRHDYLLNLLQTAIETVFFYNPAVWWVGKQMRLEREHCCDDIAVEVCGNALQYASALAEMEEIRDRIPEPALAASGGELLGRIRRLLGHRDCTSPSFGIMAAAVLVLSIAAVTGVVSLVAAPQAAARPSFEVASVKPVDRATMHRDHEGHRLDSAIFVDRTDLLTYIVRAYIQGGSCGMKVALGEDCALVAGTLPAWVKSDRWEIQAKLAPNSVPSYTARQLQVNDTREINLMLQVLLEDRFHLKIHRETRQIPVYAVTVGKNGPKLKPTPPKGELLKIADGSLVEHHGLSSSLRIPAPDGTLRNRMTFQASSMQDAADTLGWYFERPVIDRTSLKGEYDFVIEYDVDPNERGPAAAPNTSGLGGGYFNPFTGLTSAAVSVALQEVGLRLESTKAPVEVLVIDHVEKPSEN